MSSAWTKLRSKVGPNWGLFLFGIATLVGFINLIRPRNHTHYLIFSQAAEKLWLGVMPWLLRSESDKGGWLYSHSCGLYFFGLFSWMPLYLGMYLYMTLSVIVFVFGAKFLIETLMGKNHRWLTPTPAFNWFWFWAAYCVLGTITATKLELLMMGLTFVNLALLMRNERIWLAAFLWAMMTNWKFQPLPLIGLISIVLLMLDWRRGVKFLGWFVIFSIGWFVAPIPVLGLEKFSAFNAHYAKGLSGFIATDWVLFQHVLRLPMTLTGLKIDYRVLQFLSVVFGLLFAAYTFTYVRRLKLYQTGHAATFANLNQMNLGLLFATTLGSWYAVAFSPLSQTNAFILALPMFLVGAVLVSALSDHRLEALRGTKAMLVRGLLVAGLIGYVLTSDILGKTVRMTMAGLGVHVYGFLVGMIVVVITSHRVLDSAGSSPGR